MVEFIFEKVFIFLVSITNSYGLAILLISIVISILLMPFYYITGILENREKLIHLKLQPYISKINKIKNSQVRHKHLSELYKSYDYSPIKSLRSLSSLIIQIPVFIVAYKVLSKLLAATPPPPPPFISYGRHVIFVYKELRKPRWFIIWSKFAANFNDISKYSICNAHDEFLKRKKTKLYNSSFFLDFVIYIPSRTCLILDVK